MTVTEAVLWAELRGRGLNGWKFRRQHPVGRFVLDFYCHEARLAVEVDGDVHLSPEIRNADGERQLILEDEGIHFVRVSNADVLHRLEQVINVIESACRQQAAKVTADAPSDE